MPEWLIVVLIVGGFAAFIVYRKVFKKSKPKDSTGGFNARILGLKNTARSPLGVTIRAEAGATVTAANLDAIDRGLAECFERAGCKPYTKPGGLTHSEYIVCVLMSGGNDSTGFPAYKMPGHQYKNSPVYDPDGDGYILVAGQMFAAGNPYGNIIVVPAHPDHQPGKPPGNQPP